MNINSHNKTYDPIKKTICVALFTSLAYVATFIFRFRIVFLTLDAKDAFITIAALCFGPLSGIVISLIVSLLEMLTVSETAFWGFLMNFIQSAVFSSVAALIYKYNRKYVGAIAGLLSSVAVTTAVMIPANMLITPIYTGTSVKDVIDLIPRILLPFNFIKGVINASLVMMLYKPVITALRSVMNVQTPSGNFSKRKAVITTIVSAVIIALAVVFIIIVMNGSFKLI